MEKYEYCYECDKDVIPVIKCEKNSYTFRDKEFTVIEDIHYCPNCHNALLNDTLDDSLYNIYDSYLKLYNLSFEKIKKIRTGLNLSQELFAKVLDWSKKSIVRYETSKSVPQGEYLNMYITLNENPFYIVKLLERRKPLLGEEYYKILRLLPIYQEYRNVNTILFLLKNNTMSETNLMKNLFAVDFEMYKEKKYPMTNLKYAHMPFGPAVHNRYPLYNFILKNGYIEIESIDSEYGTKFKSSFDCDEKLFTNEELYVLKTVKNKLKGYTAKELSDWSHNFDGWKKTKNGELISYKYANTFDINSL